MKNNINQKEEIGNMTSLSLGGVKQFVGTKSEAEAKAIEANSMNQIATKDYFVTYRVVKVSSDFMVYGTDRFGTLIKVI